MSQNSTKLQHAKKNRNGISQYKIGQFLENDTKSF